MIKLELLAPAGNYKRMEIAFAYGADAVYLAGKNWGLRSGADNFNKKQLKKAFKLAKNLDKKVYVAINIVAHNDNFRGIEDYLKFLYNEGANGIIVSDLGIAEIAKKVVPKLDLHVSTQANVMNIHAANCWIRLGAKRIVLARELSFKEIAEIKNNIPSNIELEAFVHGAMCIAHSGRCLLSNVFVGRDANAGACVQACRFAYNLVRTNNPEEMYPIVEDKFGTYILNSKDLCMINYIKNFIKVGVYSLKIEGRMKSDYYVANITNVYRRVIDSILFKKKIEFEPDVETRKSSHREYTTGFYLDEKSKTNLKSSGTVQTYDVVAEVVRGFKGKALISQRNKFIVGDVLEILSPDDNFLKTFEIKEIKNLKKENKNSANVAQEMLYINCPFKLKKYDMLRKPRG